MELQASFPFAGRGFLPPAPLLIIYFPFLSADMHSLTKKKCLSDYAGRGKAAELLNVSAWET